MEKRAAQQWPSVRFNCLLLLLVVVSLHLSGKQQASKLTVITKQRLSRACFSVALSSAALAAPAPLIDSSGWCCHSWQSYSSLPSAHSNAAPARRLITILLLVKLGGQVKLLLVKLGGSKHPHLCWSVSSL